MMNWTSLIASAAPALLVPPLLLGAPEPGKPVLVVAWPGSDSAAAVDLVAKAQGHLVRSTGLPWIVVAVSDASDFAADLRHAGAWITLDASVLRGCAGRPERTDTLR